MWMNLRRLSAAIGPRLLSGLMVATLFSVYLTGCVPAVTQTDDFVLRGRTMLDGQPAAEVRVEAWPLDAGGLSGVPTYLSAPSDTEGHYQLKLPQGSYYLIARGDGLFSYYGRNPVTVGDGGLQDISIGLVREDLFRPSHDSGLASGVRVRLSLNGAPVSGGLLHVYLDLTSQLKGMGYVMVGPSGDDGIVEAALPAGTYYLLARKRADGGSMGPLRSGDFIGFDPASPVRVAAGEVTSLSIPMLEVPGRVDQQQAALFGKTVVRGVIRDIQGQPVADARVVFYRDEQMLNRPDHVSRPTGRDGRYLISLPAGGRYFIAARNTLGDAPAAGDLYGTYNETDDHSLQLETGAAVEGVDIIVEKMW